MVWLSIITSFHDISNHSTSCTSYYIISCPFTLHHITSYHVGVNLEARGANACTALAISAVNGSTEIAELLLERGANKEAGNKNGSTPLHMCCVKGTYPLPYPPKYHELP